jgi:hypothetical protein
MEVSPMQDRVLLALVGVGSTIIGASIGDATSYLENVGHMALLLSALRHLKHLERVLEEARSAKSALATFTY